MTAPGHRAVTLTPPGRPLVGRIVPPGSKSITNRALLLAGLARGESRIEGALASDDTGHMAQALRRMGVGVTQEDGREGATFVVSATGRLEAPDGPLFLGNAGTAMRFLTAAAALVEPLACGWHAVRLARRIAPLGRALVVGGGAIGLGAALALRAQGADAVTIVEPNAARADRLRALDGVVVSDNPSPAETVIDAVGIDATRAVAFSAVRPGGVIAHIGLGGGSGGFDPRYATLQEVTFFGAYTYTAEDFRETAAAIFDGRIPVVRHLDALVEIRSLAEGPDVFAALAAGRIAAPKVLLTP